jgi:hypothetical protein
MSMPMRSAHHRWLRRRAALGIAATAALVGAATPARGQFYYFQQPLGDWDSTADPYFGWYAVSGTATVFANLPPSGNFSYAEFVKSGTNGIAGATAIYNHVYAAPIAELHVDSANTVSQTSAATVFWASEERLGVSGGVGTYLQSAGTNRADGALDLGDTPTSTGIYTLAGGNLFVGLATQVGRAGSGGFTQSGGTHVTPALSVSNNSGGSGTYTLSGGLLVSTNVIIYARGAFNQSGGTHAISGDLKLDAAPPQIAAYTLSNAARLSVGSIAYIGDTGLGAFTQTGGSGHISGGTSGAAPALVFGFASTAAGTGTLSGGRLDVDAEECVGFDGAGTFTQSGGTHTALFLTLGSHATGAGTFTLSGGLLTVTSRTVVGDFGKGTFNQGGGTHATGALFIASHATTTASYNLTNGAVLTTGDLELGYFGTGVLSQGGGAMTFGGDAYLGDFAPGNGILNLGGGTFAINGHNGLYLGYDPGSRGTINTSGGTMTVSAGAVLVGYGGRGNLSVNGGTIHIAGGTNGFDMGLNVGMLAGSSGTVSLTAGSLLIDQSEIVGDSGLGTVNQFGGSHSAALLYLGYRTGSSGTFTLSGGTLSVDGTTEVGQHGSGAFNQSGGTHTASYLRLGHFAPGAYSMSNGTLSVTNDAFIGWASAGSFTQTGGTSAIGGTLVVANIPFTGTATLAGGSLTAANTYVNTGGIFHQTGGTANVGGLTIKGGPGVGEVVIDGGSFTAARATNDGQLSANSGFSLLGPLSGTGQLQIGSDSGATARATVTRFDQGLVVINNTGKLTVATNAARFTSTVVGLSISSNGLLDLGNNALLVDNVSTPESFVRLYLKNGYNAGISGIGDWLGKGGISSADAIASHNGISPDFHVSVGYVNGAYANDPLIGGPIPGQPTLPTNRILVRPALYGDYNLDGKVDDLDLQIFSGLGQYNKPSPKFGWLGGDLNHDGKVDDTDLLIFSGAGNYNGPPYGAPDGGASHASATPSLTGGGGDGGAAATTTIGNLNDGVLDFIYDPSTGDLKVHYDGDSRITAANPLQVIRLKSAGGHFLPGNFNASGFSNVTTDNSTLNGTILGAGSLPDNYDLGQILATGLGVSDLTSDLTLQWNVSGGGLSLKNGDVVVPEPAAIGLLGVGALALFARRRRRCLESHPTRIPNQYG